MKKNLLLALLFLLPFGSRAQESTAHLLPDSAFASIITCGPGDEFYTSFGHSAIRIFNPADSSDYVFNYGTFDFDIPHFYWTFARGKLNYCLSVTSFDQFIAEYRFEGRSVWEQRLRLTNQELNNLFILLCENAKPEYRYYMYDFFRDNCATRVRDQVSRALCHRSLSPENTSDTNLTYRNILYRSTVDNLLWWRLGIDMALGARCDKRCSNYEYMFSPYEMMKQFDTLTVSDTRQPIADPAVLLLPETRSPLSRSLSPTLLFWVLFLAVLTLTLLQWHKSWNMRWFDRTLFILVSIISLLAIFLWFFTDHYCTKLNLNILWASPLFIHFAVRLNRSNRYLVYIQLLMLLAAMLLTVTAFPQQLNIAVFPIALILALRLIANLHHRAIPPQNKGEKQKQQK